MELTPSQQWADYLHQIEDSIRQLEAERDKARGELASAMLAEKADTVIGSRGQTYKLSRPPAKYTFSLPLEEYKRLGILEECTPPPAPPKLTKIKLDDLLKKCRLDDLTVAEWQQQGWYEIERSGEITIKQVETKQDVLNQLTAKSQKGQ